MASHRGILPHLLPGGSSKHRRRNPFIREEIVDTLGDRVPGTALVDHDHGPARATQTQGSRKARGATADHNHINDSCLSMHGLSSCCASVEFYSRPRRVTQAGQAETVDFGRAPVTPAGHDESETSPPVERMPGFVARVRIG